MFSIYSDGDLLYAPSMTRQGYQAFSPTLTMELNKAGSLEFSLPYGSKGYNAYSKLKSIITVEQDGTEIWRGRVLDDTEDINRNKKLTCEGELAFLNDEMVRPGNYSGVSTLQQTFNAIMNAYSSVATDYRKIYAGNVNGSNASVTVNPTLEEPNRCINELSDKIIDPYGGYLFLRHQNGSSYLDYYTTISKVSDQVIEFGKNLLDFEKYIDASNVYTILIPYGAKNDSGNRITVASVNNGNDWISSSSGIELFGRITEYKVWDEITDPSTLLITATQDLNSAVEVATTITITAIDLHLLDVDESRFEVGMYVPVISRPHNIDSNFLLTKINLDLENPEGSTYTLGTEESYLTDRQVSTNKTANTANSTANTVSSAIMGDVAAGYVSKQQLQEALQTVNESISDLQTDLDENYVTQTDFDALEQRVTDLEGNA